VLKKSPKMASKKADKKEGCKLQKYPTIIDYIHSNHPKLYDVIDCLNMRNSFTPRKNTTGITFLLPNDKYVDEIKTQAESAEPEKATDMIFSLIIPSLIKSPDDWKGEIGNLLPQKIEVVSTEGKAVKIKSGTLTLNKEFVPFDRYGKMQRGNMAIWNLEGKVDMNAPEMSHEKLFKKKKEKEGAAETVSIKEIIKFKYEIEQSEQNLLQFACMIIEFAKKDQAMYEKLKFLAVPNYIVFAELVFGSIGKLFQVGDLEELLKEKNKPKADKAVYDKFVSEASSMKRDDFSEERDSHVNLILQKAVDAATMSKEIMNVYRIVDTNNKMGFPDSVSNVLKDKKDFHLTIDVAAFVFGMYIDKLPGDKLKTIMQDVRVYFDQNNEIKFERLQNMLNSTELITKFVKSCCFLRYPGSFATGGDSDSEDTPGNIDKFED
jgi:hypothetical protein